MLLPLQEELPNERKGERRDPEPIASFPTLTSASNTVGIDKWLKANTVKSHTISLHPQDQMHYAALLKMKLDMLEPLMVKFGEMLHWQQVFRELFGLI